MFLVDIQEVLYCLSPIKVIPIQNSCSNGYMYRFMSLFVVFVVLINVVVIYSILFIDPVDLSVDNVNGTSNCK